MTTRSFFSRLPSPTAQHPTRVEVGKAHRVVTNDQDLVVATRALLLANPSHGVVLVGKTAKLTVARDDAQAECARVVPSQGPAHPLVAFVAYEPSTIDAVRGMALCGPPGATFQKHYLEPLGLTRDQVLVTHTTPLAKASGTPGGAGWRGWCARELDRYNAPITVALGRLAKAILGDRADVVLPHPATRELHKSDTSELCRKLRVLAARVHTLQQGEKRTVRIGKSAPIKQIVYGACLDPYQFDSQSDWVPPADVEKAAHNYLMQSRVVNLQHEAPARAQVVESWLVHYPSDADYRAAMMNEPHRAYDMPMGNQTVHSGTWMMGVKIEDPAVWQAVQNGDITAFSIGGTGYRTDVDRDTAMPDVTFVKP